jgi:hypothetical protein
MVYTKLTPSADEISAMRSLIPDNDAIFGAAGNENLFTDTELGNYYSVARGSVLRGSAYACTAIGNSEALISKKIIEQDLATDGPAVAAAFLNNAKLLLARADLDDLVDADNAFIIVDYNPVPYPFWGRGTELTEPLYPFGGDPGNIWP